MNTPVDDLDRIMAVMQAAFDPAYGEAWNRRQVEDALLIGNCHYGLVSVQGTAPRIAEPAAGFFLSRHGFEEEELLLLAVTPQHRRGGLASLLIERLKTEARARGARRILLEMRRGNPAEALYRRYGFLNIGERRDYYRQADGSRLDALTFALEMN